MNCKLSQLQKRLLPMLGWFHDFCIDNGIRYYILCGTMLGAARHHGFIPWDDDIDVGIPRADYEKFLSLTKGKRFGDYLVEGIDTKENDFFYGYAKVYDTQSVLVENTRYSIKRGIYIDVFPLDGVTNDRVKIEQVVKPIFYRYQLLLARTCAIRKNRKWYKNLAIYLARIIPDFIVNSKKLMQSIDERCKTHDYDSCKYVGNLYGTRRGIVPKEVMGTPTLYQFEDLMVYGVENYDAYLTSVYGEWRKLPPVEKQVTHHDFKFMKLEQSYLEL